MSSEPERIEQALRCLADHIWTAKHSDIEKAMRAAADEIDHLRAEIAEADYACRVTGDKLVMVKEERDRFQAELAEFEDEVVGENNWLRPENHRLKRELEALRAELGSYGPQETPVCSECGHDRCTTLDCGCDCLRHPPRLVRRGPWVTKSEGDDSDAVRDSRPTPAQPTDLLPAGTVSPEMPSRDLASDVLPGTSEGYGHRHDRDADGHCRTCDAKPLAAIYKDVVPDPAGPWVTTEKPTADIRDDASEGVSSDGD